MSLLTEPTGPWSPAATDGDALHRATRLVLACLAVTHLAMTAVAAATLSGGRLRAAVSLYLCVAVVLGAAFVMMVARGRRAARAAAPVEDGPSHPPFARTPDSALVPAAHRTGESFFDQLPAQSAPPGGGLAELAVTASLLLAGVVPAAVALATAAPWAVGASCLAVIAGGVVLRGRRLGAVWSATGGVWAGAAAYGVAGALVTAADGAPARAGELSPTGLAGSWAQAALAVLGSVAVAGVLAQSLTGARLAMAQAADAAQSRSVRDPLTGLSNRLGLEMVAGPMIENARRNGQAVHCLYLDVDDFRTLNELAGMHIGDEVLLAVAEAVLGSIRGTDVAARWDGDEFVVVGPGTGTSPLELERRVRAQLAAFPPVPPTVWSGRVSIGSAMLVPWDDGDLDSLLRRADQDMGLRRSLRRQGRDRVGGPQGPLAGRRDQAAGPHPEPDADPRSYTIPRSDVGPGSDDGPGPRAGLLSEPSPDAEAPVPPIAPDADGAS